MIQTSNKFTVIDLKPNSQEWLDFRKNKIGASDVPIIMGISPWKTPLQLWEEKTLNKTQAPNSAMIRGSRLESDALQWYNIKYWNLRGIFKTQILKSNEFPWAMCSLDGFLFYKETDLEGKSSEFIEIVEIKCPGKESHSVALSGHIPDYYYPQLQWQMWITGVKEMDYVSFDGEDGVVLKCQFNQDFFDRKIWPAVIDFKECMDNGIPPKESDKDVCVIIDDELEKAAKLYVEGLDALKDLESNLQEIKTYIESKCSSPRNKIGKLLVTKVIKKGSVDNESIYEKFGVNPDEFRKPQTMYWKFTVER